MKARNELRAKSHPAPLTNEMRKRLWWRAKRLSFEAAKHGVLKISRHDWALIVYRILRADNATQILNWREQVKCDHIVGHYYDGEDLGTIFTKVSDVETEYPLSVHTQFDVRHKFCPECGDSLAEFWEHNSALV